MSNCHAVVSTRFKLKTYGTVKKNLVGHFFILSSSSKFWPSLALETKL